jgi:hypothetical protein
MKISTASIIDLAMAAARRDGDNFRIAQRDDGSVYGSYADQRSDYADHTVANIAVSSWTDCATLRNQIARAIDGI